MRDLTSDASAASYRPEIDGLRAIAVLSVVLYHAGFSGVPGGYVGVDVFFVISGFLITGLIRQQVAAHTFSFRAFYLRRARRLLPALLATTVASLVAAAVLLSPVLLEQFGASAMYASFSASNWFFFRQSNYFDASAISKPLLHTWSLSVEEQFYLVWPALLLALGAGRRRAPTVILVVGLASFAACEVLRAHSEALFYLTPFRVFEFSIGGVLVWIMDGPPSPNWVREAGLATGLTLIVASVAGLGTRTFTQSALLIPCVGSALAIYSGSARVHGVLLRNGMSVAIGKVSYSAYLVHWPILVFVRYMMFDDFTTAARLWILVATAGATLALYSLVERPFRTASRSTVPSSGRRFLLGYVSALAIVVVTSANMARHGGWLWRYPSAIQRQIRADAIARDKAYTWQAFRSADRPFAGDARRKVLLVGDSQGADVANMLSASGQTEAIDLSTIEVDMECQSLISFSTRQYEMLAPRDRSSCAAAVESLRDSVRIGQADEAVLALNWDERGLPFIGTAVARLHQWGVRKVYVVGRKSQGLSGPEIVVRYGIAPGIEHFSARRRNRIAVEANARIAAMRGDFVFVDLMSAVCPASDRCRVLTGDTDIIFFDATHFTPGGAKYVASLLMQNGMFRL